MAVTILSTPAHAFDVSPEILSRWLATESPNNFRLQRKDFAVTNQADSGGYLRLTLGASFTGQEGDAIAVYNSTNGAMYIGTVTDVPSPATTITTDIPWEAGMVITYLNDNTLRGGYYFEGQLTVNGVVQALTIIASPDSFGAADLDVSGVLRIMVAIGKTGDYTDDIMVETNKGGSFTFAYRECWYSSNESYTQEGNTWYYVEAVRSIEQGSNLYDFVPSEAGDAPFLNAFAQPVYFAGLPFDISFLLPAQEVTSPAKQLQIVVKRYNATNVLLGTSTTLVALTGLEGKVCSLKINPAVIEASATYLTAEINVV